MAASGGAPRRIAKTLLTFGYMVALEIVAVLKGLWPRPSVGPDLADAAAHLRRDGFVALPGYWPADRVDQVRRALMETMPPAGGDFDLLNRVSYFRRPRPDQAADGGVFRLFGAHRVHAEVDGFRRDPLLKGIIETAFRTGVCCNTTLAQLNLPEGSETRGFHIDMYAPREFKAFLFLTDVEDERLGPYAIVPGSHRWHGRRLANYLVRGLLNREPVTDVGPLGAAEGTVRRFTVPKGTLVISSQQAIHRGWPLLEGHRLVLANYYVEKITGGPDFKDDDRLGYRYATQPA